MKKKQLHVGSRPYQIVEYLILGSGILLIALTSPRAGATLVQAGIRSYIRNKRFEKEKFLRDIKNLQKKEIVDYKEKEDGTVEIRLGHQGKEIELRYKLDTISIKKPKQWDGKWRLVLFDIPHAHKKARNAFRGKLQELGFYPLQKSVFITPYQCEEEIIFIASIFDIQRYVLMLHVARFEGEEKLKHHFFGTHERD